jgi:glycosyltransferase involved in cell wall biosynthesis
MSGREQLAAGPTPLVSVIMPVMNAARTLPAALRSILWQTHTDWELILIDDGSTDATLALARACVDPRVRVVDGGANLGLAARLNQAIELARGQFIARMDADDIAYPERLAAQVKFMLDHPQCDLVGCAALIFDDAGVIRGRFALRATHEEICARPWAGFPLPHPTWLGKRAWFARFGYRADYRKTQDQDLLLRSYTQSRFACVAQILLGYRQERRTLKKLLAGRLNFSRSIVREAWRRGAWSVGLAGLAGQAAKAAVDLATVPPGWDRHLRGESAAAVTAAEQQAWRGVWTAATCKDEKK